MMRRESPRRAGVILLFVVGMLLVAACSGTISKPSGAGAGVSGHAKVAQTSSRVVARNRARLVGALRQAWQRRRAVAVAKRDARNVSRNRQVLQVVDTRDVCATGGPVATRAQRQARRVRELQRRRALYYLNLSCPAA